MEPHAPASPIRRTRPRPRSTACSRVHSASVRWVGGTKSRNRARPSSASAAARHACTSSTTTPVTVRSFTPPRRHIPAAPPGRGLALSIELQPSSSQSPFTLKSTPPSHHANAPKLERVSEVRVLRCPDPSFNGVYCTTGPPPACRRVKGANALVLEAATSDDALADAEQDDQQCPAPPRVLHRTRRGQWMLSKGWRAAEKEVGTFRTIESSPLGIALPCEEWEQRIGGYRKHVWHHSGYWKPLIEVMAAIVGSNTFVEPASSMTCRLSVASPCECGRPSLVPAAAAAAAHNEGGSGSRLACRSWVAGAVEALRWNDHAALVDALELVDDAEVAQTMASPSTVLRHEGKLALLDWHPTANGGAITRLDLNLVVHLRFHDTLLDLAHRLKTSPSLRAELRARGVTAHNERRPELAELVSLGGVTVQQVVHYARDPTVLFRSRELRALVRQARAMGITTDAAVRTVVEKVCGEGRETEEYYMQMYTEHVNRHQRQQAQPTHHEPGGVGRGGGGGVGRIQLTPETQSSTLPRTTRPTSTENAGSNTGKRGWQKVANIIKSSHVEPRKVMEAHRKERNMRQWKQIYGIDIPLRLHNIFHKNEDELLHKGLLQPLRHIGSAEDEERCARNCDWLRHVSTKYHRRRAGAQMMAKGDFFLKQQQRHRQLAQTVARHFGTNRPQVGGGGGGVKEVEDSPSSRYLRGKLVTVKDLWQAFRSADAVAGASMRTGIRIVGGGSGCTGGDGDAQLDYAQVMDFIRSAEYMLAPSPDPSSNQAHHVQHPAGPQARARARVGVSEEHARGLFATADANGDGLVTLGELSTALCASVR